MINFRQALTGVLTFNSKVDFLKLLKFNQFYWTNAIQIQLKKFFVKV